MGLTAIFLFALLPIVRGPTIESGWVLSFEHMACAALAAALVFAFATPLKTRFPTG